MKNLTFCSLFLCMYSNIHFQIPTFANKDIARIIVYTVEKGKERFIGVTEISIKKNINASKIEIADAKCLNEIQKKIKELKEMKGVRSINNIFMLCEITYKDASRQTLSFEDSNNGLIKIGNKIYSNSNSLESWLLFCQSNP